MIKVVVIDLWPIESECHICGSDLFGCKQGLAIYEDLLVPDDYEGDWGGVDACERCYHVARSMLSGAKRLLPLSAVRSVVIQSRPKAANARKSK